MFKASIRIRPRNSDHITSQILTYDGNERSAYRRWADCMDYDRGRSWRSEDYLNEGLSWQEAGLIKANEDECIKKVNEDIKREAAGKATFFARTDKAALHNPFHLETPNTPRRPPRPQYEHRPADHRGDVHSYVFQENEKEIISKLKTYDGQPFSSWLMFTECMVTWGAPYFSMANYLEERLTPAQMEWARDQEDSCVGIVNDLVDGHARSQQKRASVPVRTYAPLNPRSQTQHRNAFSTDSVAALAQHAARFVTTESHRLHVGALARPLLRLMRDAPKKVPAWEVKFAE
ncbi:MAG: hypothetical protein M1826_006190 [Phylliscum demangeonii]|nr:MAG: hypothetical protein M1826_006190 [Phylliscum demangeonii]